MNDRNRSSDRSRSNDRDREQGRNSGAGSRQMVPATLRLRAAEGPPSELRCEGGALRPATDDAPALILIRCQQLEIDVFAK